MKLNLLATVVAAAASLVAVNANAYQAEVGATLNAVSPDVGKNQTGFGLDGTYYFNNVQNNSSQPMAEQAFLQNASNATAKAIYSRDGGDNNTTTVGAGVTYFIPNTQFAALAEVSHDREKSAGTVDSKTTKAKAGVGFKPNNNLLLKAGVDHTKAKGEKADTSPFLGAKLLTQVGGKDVSLAADAALGDIKTFDLGADYYIDRTLSVGLGYQVIDGKESVDDDDAFTFRAKKFFTNEFSLEGSAKFGDHAKTYGVRGAYRF